MLGSTTKRKADLKIVILGCAEVGKTTFIHRYIDGEFKDVISTIGASFFLKQHRGYNIAIWDTAGEERFAGLSNFYCRNAGAAILAFDMTEAGSFNLLHSRFLPLIDTSHDCLIVVVGMKSDRAGSTLPTHTTSQDGRALATSINKRPLTTVPYFETSSITGQGVADVFKYILEVCLPDRDGPSIAPPISSSHHTLVAPEKKSPSSSRKAKQKKGCC